LADFEDFVDFEAFGDFEEGTDVADLSAFALFVFGTGPG